MSKHVAFIPARKGSKGFKLKNRILFSHTANFLNQIEWLAEVVVSTDDPVIKELASDYGYSVHTRPDMLASDDVSIKDVIDFYNLCRILYYSGNIIPPEFIFAQVNSRTILTHRVLNIYFSIWQKNHHQ